MNRGTWRQMVAFVVGRVSGPCGVWALVLAGLVGSSGCSVWTSVTGKHPSDDPSFEKFGYQQKVLEDEVSPQDDLTDFLHPAVLETERRSIPPLLVGPPPESYVIGPTDVLYVNVYGQPGMGSPMIANDGKVLGSRIDGQGQIQLPLIGSVYVAGHSIGQVQRKLQRLYGKLIAEPWVVVEVVEHRSQPVYLMGQFEDAGVFYMDRPTSLMQAIALGQLTDDADLRGARLIRGRRTMPVDIYSLLREGAVEQNVWLKPKDTLYVPNKRDQQVFVLGDVGLPGPVPMINGRLTMTQALAAAGNFKRAGANTERVRIIRSISSTRGELIVVDLKRILRGEALPFHLNPGDVVYIPRNQLGSWNDSISEMLPTLSLISNLLTPFVQVEFLSR